MRKTTRKGFEKTGKDDKSRVKTTPKARQACPVLNKTCLALSKILIVEDDDDLRESISMALRDEGYRVRSAPDVDEAIARVKEDKFAVIFMDICLPDRNGVEAYKVIKKIAPTSKTVMMTGYFVPDLVNEAIREGAYDILYKPFTMEDILTVIKKITG